jgi:pSer/pThr/pTyr-binding forkhead associated (FHA) protein
MEIKCTYRDTETRHALEEESVTVGRANPFLPPGLDLSNDILVSRTHARIWLREGRWWLEDLGSKHGTWVNGVKLDYRRQLNDGDVIRVGETTLELGAPPRTPPPAGGITEPRPVTDIQTALNVEEFVPAQRPAVPAHTDAEESLLPVLARELAGCESTEAVASHLVRTLAAAFPRARRTVVLLKDSDFGTLRPVASQPEGGHAYNELIALRSIAEGRALLWRESLDNLSAEGNRRRTGASGLCAPMFRQRRAVGVICLEGSEAEEAFTEADLKLLLGLAGVAALALA